MASSYFAGVDVGSLCTKSVIINSEGQVLASSIIRSGAFYQGAAEASLKEALKEAGLEQAEIANIMATGYGRAKVSFASGHMTEITCHARGALSLFPEVKTVIDIGGQDSKVIYLNAEGRPNNFVMNDKCAAGTGRFLEVMAHALEMDLDTMSQVASQANNNAEVSSMCTVFAETEIISLLAQGHEKADIARAIYEAIARRITGMVGQLGFKEPGIMTGGVAKSQGMVKALERKLRFTLFVPEEPQIVGALGAALIASEEFSRSVSR